MSEEEGQPSEEEQGAADHQKKLQRLEELKAKVEHDEDLSEEEEHELEQMAEDSSLPVHAEDE